MKANEMTPEQLADEIHMHALCMGDVRDLPTSWQYAHELLAASFHTIQALEAKIKGMIERPVVEVDSPRVSADGDMLTYPVLINGETVAIYYGAEFAEEHRSDLTKALGMEGEL